VIAYIARDDNPEGGYFSMFGTKPDMRDIKRKSIVEVRQVELEDEFVKDVLEGNLPVDPDGHNDSTWFPLFKAAGPEATVWERDV
jgi:hypothetical protein